MIPRPRKKAAPPPDPHRPIVLPPWIAESAGSRASEADAAFAAGAALASLDGLVRAEPTFLGVWRTRLALKCAVEAVRLAGRSEGEAELRDAWLLRRPGDSAGPAGELYAAFRSLGAERTGFSTARLHEIAALLGIGWSEALGDIAVWADEIGQGASAAPFAAADLMRRILAARGDAELFAFWCADMMLAERLRWPVPVPLLMAERYGSGFRGLGGRGRVRSGDAGFTRAVCLALIAAAGEAVRLANDLGRRADRLALVTPQLRAKGAGDAIRLLLEDDAVSGSLTTPKLTRWASRRLFDRLRELDAVRELSGRPHFRLYGL